MAVIGGLSLHHLLVGPNDAGGKPSRLDPAHWGGDHAGEPVPGYITGDECLFCRRKEIGETWQENRHHLTIRPAVDYAEALTGKPSEPPPELALGGDRAVRFLRRSQGYGQEKSAQYDPSWSDEQVAEWEGNFIGWATITSRTVIGRGSVAGALAALLGANEGALLASVRKKKRD